MTCNVMGCCGPGDYWRVDGPGDGWPQTYCQDHYVSWVLAHDDLTLTRQLRGFEIGDTTT